MTSARLALITGAGVSTGLGRSEPLPMMGQWCERIVEALDKLEPGLAMTVGLNLMMRGDEFERALGAFLQWVRALPLMRTFAQLGSAGDLPAPEPPPELESWLVKAEERIPKVLRAVNQTLWDEFGLARIDGMKAKAAYHMLLEAVGAGPTEGTQVFSATTNYDRSAELAWNANGFAVVDGSKEAEFGGSRYLQADELAPWVTHGTIAHLHLHGAVGWYRDRPGIRIDAADRRFDDREVPAVLYPDPSKDPYNDQDAGVVSLWRILDRALSAATHILILGHSLHDRPLLAAIERAVLTSNGVRIGVTYLEHDQVSLRDLVDQLRTTTLDAPQVDLSLIPASFGPDGDLAGIRSWFSGQTVGREILEGRALPSARHLKDFKILTGEALPADSPPQGGPTIGLRHVGDKTDSFILLRDLPPDEFVLEFDAYLSEGGLLNVVFGFDEETWQGYMARFDSRAVGAERDGFLWMENGRNGEWRPEAVGESSSPAGEWFSASLTLEDGKAHIERGGITIETLPSLKVKRGAVGFFTEVATSHVANVRLRAV